MKPDSEARNSARPSLTVPISYSISSTPFFSYSVHHFYCWTFAEMFSRALRTSRAAPLRSNAFSKAALVKRTVTTDAASAHADKDAVPEVIRSLRCQLGGISMLIEVFDGYRKTQNLSKSTFQTSLSKHTSSILPHIPSIPQRRN